MIDITQAYAELRAKISQLRQVDISPGSNINDLFLIPISYTQAKLEVLLNFFTSIQSIDGLISLLQDTTKQQTFQNLFEITNTELLNILDSYALRLVSNYGVERLSASKTTGVVIFYSNTAPGDPEGFIPAGTYVQSTIAGTQYITTTDVPYTNGGFNLVTGLWELKAPVECITEGTVGNIQAGEINLTTYPNFSVTNRVPFTNGRDTETTVDMLIRAKNRLLGIVGVTQNGIKQIILGTNLASDIAVFGANNPYMYRNKFGGAIDVYCISEDTEQKTDIINASDISENNTFILPSTPALEIISIKDNNNTLLAYNFFPDTNWKMYGGSSKAKDLVQITSPIFTPPLTVIYVINANINKLQTLLNSTDYALLNSDILVKQGVKRLVTIHFSFSNFIEYRKEELEILIRAAINKYIGNLKLGEALSQSDIVGIVEKIEGVDKVNVPFGIFKLDNSLQEVNDILEVAPYEYIRPKEIIIS